MNRTIRIVLAFLVLISQMGMSAIVCACPEPPRESPAEASADVCPMSGQAGCQCCAPPAKPTTDSAYADGSSCVTAQNDFAATDKALAHSFVPDVAAELAVECLAREQAIVKLDIAPVHLVVPKIRPPDQSSHGLRAPPAF